MGKIYKNETVTTYTTPTKITPRVVPLDQFDSILQNAQILINARQYAQALPLLLNLEVTNFNHVGVHELLADVFLNLNQIELAKEQCQIYAKLLQQDQNDANTIKLKSFEELYKEAGDFNSIQQEFSAFQQEEITPDNFYHGTNIALKMATHYMAQQRYQEAEQLLIEHKQRYMQFIKKEEE